ncbi:hypothetical protein Tco_1162161 [Tanacetum coccineum]
MHPYAPITDNSLHSGHAITDTDEGRSRETDSGSGLKLKGSYQSHIIVISESISKVHMSRFRYQGFKYQGSDVQGSHIKVKISRDHSKGS